MPPRFFHADLRVNGFDGKPVIHSAVPFEPNFANRGGNSSSTGRSRRAKLCHDSCVDETLRDPSVVERRRIESCGYYSVTLFGSNSRERILVIKKYRKKINQEEISLFQTRTPYARVSLRVQFYTGTTNYKGLSNVVVPRGDESRANTCPRRDPAPRFIARS